MDAEVIKTRVRWVVTECDVTTGDVMVAEVTNGERDDTGEDLKKVVTCSHCTMWS